MKSTSKASIVGILPLIFFLVIYIATGVGSGNFSSMPLLIGIVLACALALCLDKPGVKTSFDKKIAIFTRAAGEETIVLMFVIFLMAGAFYSVADAMGSVSSIVNLGLNILPSQMILPGIFLIGCLLSFSMGTSMGAISALAPIGIAIAHQVDGNIALVMATVVGGGMFGDNCSFVSDTTIAATRTQGVNLKDKFKANFIVILPAVIITCIILALIPFGNGATAEYATYSLLNIFPYLAIIVTALMGINVITVLTIGIVSGLAIGFFHGSFTFVESLGVLQRGMGWMQNLAAIAIMVGGLVGLMKYYGGIDYLLEKISENVNSKKGGEFGIAALVSSITLATTNNTISIITAGPLAKDISKEYDIDPKRVASLLDIFSSAMQGLMPYAGQILLVAGLAQISPVAVMPYCFYPMLMVVMGIVSIAFDFPNFKSSDEIEIDMDMEEELEPIAISIDSNK